MTKKARSKMIMQRVRSEGSPLTTQEALLLVDVLEDLSFDRLPERIRREKLDVRPLWSIKRGLREANWGLWDDAAPRAVPDRLGMIVKNALDMFALDHIGTVQIRHLLGEAAQGHGSFLRIADLDILRRRAGLIQPAVLSEAVIEGQLSERVVCWKILETMPTYEAGYDAQGRHVPKAIRQRATA